MRGSIVRRAALVALFAVLSTAPMAVAAQDEPSDPAVSDEASPAAEFEEEIAVTATRMPEPADQAPVSVTVVERQQVEMQSAIERSPSYLLANTVPGFGPSTNALSNFGQTLRGRDFLVLIDGVPQSAPLRSSSRDLGTLSVDAVERVEVVRGGSAAFGFGATGGIVNYVTRRIRDEGHNGRVELGGKISTEEVGDESLHGDLSLHLDGRQGRWSYLLNATRADRGGIFDADGDRIPPDPLGVQGGLADTTEESYLAKLAYDLSDLQSVELTVNRFEVFQDSEYTFGVGNPAAGVKTPAVRGNPNVLDPGTENTVAHLRWSHRELAGSRVELSGYYGDLTARFGKFPGFAQSEVRSEKHGSRLTVNTPLGSDALRLDWGLDYLADDTVQVGIDGPTIVPEMSQSALAAFAGVDWSGDRGSLHFGLRQEHVDLDVDDVVNRRGVFVEGAELAFDETLLHVRGLLHLSPDLDLYGGFSQSFSVGDVGRAIRDSRVTRAAELEEEAQVVDQYEVGLRLDRGRWQGSLTAFRSESDRGTTFDSDLFLVLQPEEVQGLEATFDGLLTARWRAGGTASWMEGEIDLDGDGRLDSDLPTVRVPPVKITAYAEVRPLRDWVVRLQGLYSGSRDADSPLFGSAPVESYYLFDLFAQAPLGPGAVRVGVENLLNEDYFPLVTQATSAFYAYAAGPGRSLRLGYVFGW